MVISKEREENRQLGNVVMDAGKRKEKQDGWGWGGKGVCGKSRSEKKYHLNAYRAMIVVKVVGDIIVHGVFLYSSNKVHQYDESRILPLHLRHEK
jgi:hypothetical protein